MSTHLKSIWPTNNLHNSTYSPVKRDVDRNTNIAMRHSRSVGLDILFSQMDNRMTVTYITWFRRVRYILPCCVFTLQDGVDFCYFLQKYELVTAEGPKVYSFLMQLTNAYEWVNRDMNFQIDVQQREDKSLSHTILTRRSSHNPYGIFVFQIYFLSSKLTIITIKNMFWIHSSENYQHLQSGRSFAHPSRQFNDTSLYQLTQHFFS